MRAEFWENVHVLGDVAEFNQTLEHDGRVADFLEFAELMCLDALERNESCGGHFRLEHQAVNPAQKNVVQKKPVPDIIAF